MKCHTALSNFDLKKHFAILNFDRSQLKIFSRLEASFRAYELIVFRDVKNDEMFRKDNSPHCSIQHKIMKHFCNQ